MSDKCGFEDTTTGHPCQHPAESCPVAAHTQAAADGGRPSKYTEDRREDILEAARRGTTVEGCARAAGIGQSTLYDWLNEYPEFSDKFRRARAEGEERLLRSEDVPATFILERSYGYTKKTELEHSGEIEGFEFTIQYDDD